MRQKLLVAGSGVLVNCRSAGQQTTSLAGRRRPEIQGRAAALPYREGEDFCLAPLSRGGQLKARQGGSV